LNIYWQVLPSEKIDSVGGMMEEQLKIEPLVLPNISEEIVGCYKVIEKLMQFESVSDEERTLFKKYFGDSD
jgi:hypothetical protein